jgi:SAM-dependent methyltransferase
MTPDWVFDFFDQHYGSMGLDWSVDQQDTVASGLCGLLSLAPGMTVFDQCCGRGGLGSGLSRKGIHSIGVELNGAYVQDATRGAPKGPGQARFIADDAFSFAPDVPVDASVNWHSSFGYAGMEGAGRLIERMRHHLKPGGRWLLELPNPLWMARHFSPELRTNLEGAHAGEELVRHSHWEDQWLCQDWEVLREGKVIWQQKGTRCWHFSLPDLETLVEQTGDREVGLFGALDGKALDAVDPRMILVVEKNP